MDAEGFVSLISAAIPLILSFNYLFSLKKRLPDEWVPEDQVVGSKTILLHSLKSSAQISLNQQTENPEAPAIRVKQRRK